jgi:hypothetical protein
MIMTPRSRDFHGLKGGVSTIRILFVSWDSSCGAEVLLAFSYGRGSTGQSKKNPPQNISAEGCGLPATLFRAVAVTCRPASRTPKQSSRRRQDSKRPSLLPYNNRGSSLHRDSTARQDSKRPALLPYNNRGSSLHRDSTARQGSKRPALQRRSRRYRSPEPGPSTTQTRTRSRRRSG